MNQNVDRLAMQLVQLVAIQAYYKQIPEYSEVVDDLEPIIDLIRGELSEATGSGSTLLPETENDVNNQVPF